MIKSLLIGILSFLLVLAILVLLIRLLENRLSFHPWREIELEPMNFGLKALTPSEFRPI